MQIDTVLLQQMMDEKLVSVTKHPQHNLFIYNYTAKAQYDKVWNNITLLTRGLILDEAYQIVARGFKKFFNFDEIDIAAIPQLPFVVQEKLDGSLGILYWVGNTAFIASRGSFDSKQAQHATAILHNKYGAVVEKLQKDKTYLFEIIYPANRIVVDYGNEDDLILLAVIDNETGLDEELDTSLGFRTVAHFEGLTDFGKIAALNLDNKEGFVIKFQNGFRVKIKFSEYVKLHRIITGVSNIAIWEYMKEAKDIDVLLDKVPDEFYNWVKQTKNNLQQHYDTILSGCQFFKY